MKPTDVTFKGIPVHSADPGTPEDDWLHGRILLVPALPQERIAEHQRRAVKDGYAINEKATAPTEPGKPSSPLVACVANGYLFGLGSELRVSRRFGETASSVTVSGVEFLKTIETPYFFGFLQRCAIEGEMVTVMVNLDGQEPLVDYCIVQGFWVSPDGMGRELEMAGKDFVFKFTSEKEKP